jgi:2-polyprenyl-3-methyl-5-hydroxy-6-metoxy-1,4-benzoquinol methylase
MANEQNPEKLGNSKSRPGSLIHLDELNYINRCHDYSHSSFRGPQSGSILGKIWRRLRHGIWSLLVSPELDAYLGAEAEFHAQIARCLNEISRASDTHDCRMDDEYRASLHTLEKRLTDALGELRAESTRNISALQVTAEHQAQQIAALDAVVRGLESIIAGFGRSERTAELSQGQSPGNSIMPEEGRAKDYSYLLFENRYRGSEAEVAKRLEIYPEVFRGSVLPVLEIGAGRGELQELFRKSGIESYGLELDSAMVERCLEKGLTVRAEEGLSHMTALDNGSLGGVVAIQVVEHLSKGELISLFELCLSKVRSSGKVVFETINTASLSALCQNYFRDPSHKVPLHPETMQTMMEYAGFRVLEVRKLSPYPGKAVLQKMEVQDYMTPRWVATVELLNHNIETLNQLLYGHQDYCIIAEVRPSALSC